MIVVCDRAILDYAEWKFPHLNARSGSVNSVSCIEAIKQNLRLGIEEHRWQRHKHEM